MNEDISLYMFTYFHSMLICCCLFANLRPVYPTLCFSVVVCLPIYVLFIQLYVYLLTSLCESKSCLSNSMFICCCLFANLRPVCYVYQRDFLTFCPICLTHFGSIMTRTNKISHNVLNIFYMYLSAPKSLCPFSLSLTLCLKNMFDDSSTLQQRAFPDLFFFIFVLFSFQL